MLMSYDLNPLLKKQLLEFNSFKNGFEDFPSFLQKVNESYLSLETSIKQLEQSLEIHRKQKTHTNLKIENITRNANNAVDNITEVVFEIDLEGNWIYLNQAWEKLTGLKVIDCLGESYAKYLGILKPKDNLELSTLINSSFKSYCKVLEIHPSNEEPHWLDVSIKTIFSLSGQPTGYIGTICDITSQKQVELSLLQAKEKEILANKAKDEFLSTISHEIRTPLNAVISTSHLLLIENPHSSQLENLNILKDSSEHLLSLVNDVLDFGKIESGNIELENVEFNFTNVINSFLSTYLNIAEEKEINFSVNRDYGIPEILIGDATRLAQILRNLISNAIKFTSSGGVVLNIKKSKKTNKHVTLNFEIIDTGIGISTNERQKIFNSFTQANTTTARKFGGTGLGLSICKKLLQLMGSKINLQSEPGIGSIFSFPLTFEIGDENQHRKDLEIQENTLSKSLKGMSVLVAEDNKVNCLVLRKFLSKWDISFEIATDGNEAVEKYQNGSFDLILMDIMMPNMNGFEATKIIRKFDSNIPIIALSAATAVHMEKEYDEAGMNGHISKPFNPNTLFSTLKRMQTIGYKKVNYLN